MEMLRKLLLLSLLVCLLSGSAVADSYVETADVMLSFDVDTCNYLTLDGSSNITWGISDSITSWGYTLPTRTHCKTLQYFHHLDSHLVRARIECDTLFGQVEYEDGDSTLTGYRIERLRCDTIYRFEYDSIYADKRNVWLDSVQYDKLIQFLEER